MFLLTEDAGVGVADSILVMLSNCCCIGRLCRRCTLADALGAVEDDAGWRVLLALVDCLQQ